MPPGMLAMAMALLLPVALMPMPLLLGTTPGLLATPLLLATPTRRARTGWSDAPVLSLEAEVRARPLVPPFDKKSYAIGFTEEDRVTEVDADVKAWARTITALHGPFLDKTLLRNYICYQLAGEIMPYTPDTRFCEVFQRVLPGVCTCAWRASEFNENAALT